MNSYIYAFIAIAVNLVTVAVAYHVRRKRFTNTYRLTLFSRDYTSFVDAIRAISKALDTDAETEPEPEQTKLSERQTEE